MKTVNISGKEYVTVNERLKYFREKYPDHSLVTDLVDVNADHALVKASIVDPAGRILAQGTAYETAGSSFINKTSHVENAETSAWGRALGNFGIGIDASVATADEVANAVANQERPPRVRKPIVEATDEQIRDIGSLCQELGGSVLALYRTYKINGRPTADQAEAMLKTLREKKALVGKELDAIASRP